MMLIAGVGDGDGDNENGNGSGKNTTDGDMVILPIMEMAIMAMKRIQSHPIPHHSTSHSIVAYSWLQKHQHMQLYVEKNTTLQILRQKARTLPSAHQSWVSPALSMIGIRKLFTTIPTLINVWETQNVDMLYRFFEGPPHKWVAVLLIVHQLRFSGINQVRGNE